MKYFKSIFSVFVLLFLVANFSYSGVIQGNYKVLEYDSIADLRLSSPTIEGQTANVLGYYAIGDGGGSLFSWDDTSTETDDSALIIKAVPTTGRWIRMYNTLNPRYFGAIPDGDGAGGGTDYSTELNAAFAYIADNGVKMVGGGGIYRVDSVLTCISTDITTARHDKKIIFDGEGVIFDFSGGSWSSDYTAGEQTNLFSVGTISNTSTPSNPLGIIERGLFSFVNFKIIGNEVAAPVTPSATVPLKGIVGFRLSLAQNVELKNIIVEYCTVGFETKDSWGITGTNLLSTFNWIGYSINGGSTYADWITCQSTNCAYDRVIRASTQPSAPKYGAFASVQAQTFIGHRSEDCWYATIIYPHDTAIRSIQMINAYSEGIQYDNIVAGFSFDQTFVADPLSTLSTPAGNDVDRLATTLGRYAYGATSGFALRAPQALDANVKRADLVLPVALTEIQASFLSSRVRLTGSDADTEGTTNFYDQTGELSFRVYEEENGVRFGNIANSEVTALDHYIEGTFTPTITSGVPPSGVTYTTQYGKYTRIGNRIDFILFVNWSAMSGSPSGNMYIEGLPEASANESNLNVPLSIVAQSITYSNAIAAVFLPNGVRISIIQQASGAGYVEVPVDTAGNIYISGTYYTDS